MQYITTSQAADLWNISRRRITLLANDGRIPGAVLIGSRWMIPKDAKKPEDSRTKNAQPQKATSDSQFRFRVYQQDDKSSFSPPLSAEEITFRKAANFFMSCQFDKLEGLLGELPIESSNRYNRILAEYVSCMICFVLDKVRPFLDFYGKLTSEFNADFPHKQEMLCFLAELNASAGILNTQKNTFIFDPKYPYHPDMLSHLAACQTISIFYSGDYTGSERMISSCELNCEIFERTSSNAIDLQTMHLYLGLMNEALGKKDNKEYHLRRAFELAEKYKLYWSPAMEYYYYGASFDTILKDYSKEFLQKLRNLSIEIHNRREAFFKNSSVDSVFELLPKKKFIFVYYAVQGFGNKEIADFLHISERAVKKNYSIIYESLGVKSKKELVELFKAEARRM